MSLFSSNNPSPSLFEKLLALVFDEKKAFKQVPNHWQHYGFCILFHLLLPLFPLGAEYALAGYVKTSTLALSASMYATSIGISSNSLLEFGYCIIQGIVFAVAFGNFSALEAPMKVEQFLIWDRNKTVICGFMALTFLIHSAIRYNRHVVYRLPFLEFTKKEDVEP